MEPVIQYEGQHYLRRHGKWVLDHVRVPLNLSSRLDSLAKQDPDLWQRCLTQDVSDAVSSKQGQTPVVAGQRRAVGTTAHSLLECEFDFARTLYVTANLSADWSERDKGWSFFGKDDLPALHGQALHVQLLVGAHRDAAPELLKAEGESGGILCRCESRRIELVIDLFDDNMMFNSGLQWGETITGKPMVFRDAAPVPLRIKPEAADMAITSAAFSLLLTVEPPEPKPAPIYFEWSKRFFPGGLPSLGKRHS